MYYQEIVAHQGAIPELVIDPTNRWFATGSQDRTIRVRNSFIFPDEMTEVKKGITQNSIWRNAYVFHVQFLDFISVMGTNKGERFTKIIMS